MSKTKLPYPIYQYSVALLIVTTREAEIHALLNVLEIERQMEGKGRWE